MIYFGGDSFMYGEPIKDAGVGRKYSVPQRVQKLLNTSICDDSQVSSSNKLIYFRQKELNKKIIKITQVDKWINSQKTENTTSTFIANIEIPNSHKTKRNKDGSYKITPPLNISKAKNIEEKYLYYLDNVFHN